jgi:hypothetical protein
MKNFPLIILLVCISSGLYAQKPKPAKKDASGISLTWAGDMQLDNSEDFEDCLLHDGTNTYMIVSKMVDKYATIVKRRFLVKFDAQMKEVSRFPLSPKEKNLNYGGAVCLKGKFIILTYKSSAKFFEVYAQKLSKDLEPDGERIALMKVSGTGGDDAFKFCRSADSSMLGIAILTDPGKSENRSYTSAVFDNDLNEKFTKKTELSLPADKTTFKEMSVGSEGALYILWSAAEESGTKFWLYKHSQEEDQKSDIKLSGKFLINSKLTVRPGGDPLLFVSYGNKATQIEGFDILAIESSGGKVSKVNYALQKELLDKIERTHGNTTVVKAGITSEFQITESFLCSNGSTFTVLEAKARRLAGQKHIYYSYGIIVLKTDAGGNVQWANYIPKLQLGELAGLYGHTTMFRNDQLLVFYNEDPGNNTYDISKAAKEPKVMSGGTTFTMMKVEFADDGTMKRTNQSASSKFGTNILMGSSQVSNNRMILFTVALNMAGPPKSGRVGFLDF